MLRLSRRLPALRYSQSGTRIGTFGLARYVRASTAWETAARDELPEARERALYEDDSKFARRALAIRRCWTEAALWG